jgi:hypothetical protein
VQWVAYPGTHDPEQVLGLAKAIGHSGGVPSEACLYFLIRCGLMTEEESVKLLIESTRLAAGVRSRLRASGQPTIEPCEHPLWKRHRIAGGFVLYPEDYYTMPDGQPEALHWFFDSPCGRGTGVLDCIYGRQVYDLGDREAPVPPHILRDLIRWSDKLADAGLF